MTFQATIKSFQNRGHNDFKIFTTLTRIDDKVHIVAYLVTEEGNVQVETYQRLYHPRLLDKSDEEINKTKDRVASALYQKVNRFRMIHNLQIEVRFVRSTLGIQTSE